MIMSLNFLTFTKYQDCALIETGLFPNSNVSQSWNANFVSVVQDGDFIFDSSNQRELAFDLKVTPFKELQKNRRDLFDVPMMLQGWKIRLAR